MIVPNKAIRYQESILSKLPRTLQTIRREDKPALALYRELQSDYSSINQFMIALDTLFILGKITIESGEIKNAD